MTWTKYQHFTGRHAAPDLAPSQQLNRFDWYSAHNWKVPYPGDKKILSPSQVSVPYYLWGYWERKHF
jgi:hypothetical protein